MTSMFDYDDSVNLAYNAKIAGKNLIAAKHELLNKTGEFLFLAHSDREFALRCQMIEQDIEGVAYRRLASLSDSKAKLVRAAFDEWQLRHASCSMCKTANPEGVYHSDPSGSVGRQTPTRMVYERSPGEEIKRNDGSWSPDYSHKIYTTDHTGRNYVQRVPCSGEESCKYCGEAVKFRRSSKQASLPESRRVANPVNTQEYESFPASRAPAPAGQITRKVETLSTGTVTCDGCEQQLDPEKHDIFTPDEKGESVQKVNVPLRGTSAPGGTFETSQGYGRGFSQGLPQVETTKQKTLCISCAKDHLRGKKPATTSSKTVNTDIHNDSESKLAPVIRDEKPQVASLSMHHDACKPTGCHPECRIQLPPKGVQSQINL